MYDNAEAETLTRVEGVIVANTEIKRVNTAVEFKADEEGSIRALFSTFGVVDRDGDIVLQSAIENGVAVPMVWHHEWDDPIGKGVVSTDTRGATFDGRFFVETQRGLEAYKTVKAMGELQEYSWGFRVLDYEYREEPEHGIVRVIKKAEIFEVSPVLKGAGVGTMTLAVKAAEGLSLSDHVETVLAAVETVCARAKSLAEIRAKEGRAISSARRIRMEEIAKQLRSGADELDAILLETAPVKSVPDAPETESEPQDAIEDVAVKEAQAVLMAEFARFERTRFLAA